LFSLAILTKTQETLPICKFIWVGPTTGNAMSDHDTGGMKKFARCAKNLIEFYCLEELDGDDIASHYIKEFREEGLNNITVKTLEGFIRDCHESQDELLRNNAALISTIFETHIKKRTREDFVALKDLFSLLTTYQGGYTLDTNIQPIQQKNFSLPHYDDFMAPALIGQDKMEVWMLYAPKNNERIKKSVFEFLQRWKRYKNSLIVAAVEAGRSFHCLNKDYPWKVKMVDGQAPMENLNLVKIYYNTHRGHAHWAKKAVLYIERNQRENLNKMELYYSHYKEMFHVAINQKNLGVIYFLLEKNLNFHSLLVTLSQDIFQKSTNVTSAFEIFSHIEEKQHLITKDQNELDEVIKKVFLWSTEYHGDDYIGFLEDNLSVPAVDLIHVLCEKNKMTLLYPLIENKDWKRLNLFLTPSLYKDLIVNALNDKVRGRLNVLIYHEKRRDWITLLLTHPFNKLLGPCVLIMLQDFLKKSEVIDPLFITNLQEIRDNNTAIEFSATVKELIFWAYNCESLAYLNFLIKKLKPEEIDNEIVQNQFSHGVQFFRRKQEFVSQCWGEGSPHTSPASGKDHCINENVSPPENKPTDTLLPVLDLSKSSLFARRKEKMSTQKKEIFGAVEYRLGLL
jgi:hypothetical protein